MRNEVDLPEIRPNGTLIATIGTRDPHCSARASCPVTSSALPVEGLGTILLVVFSTMQSAQMQSVTKSCRASVCSYEYH